MKEKVYGVKIIAFISKERDMITYFVFIDNTDLLEENLISNYISIEEIAELMQDAINL